MSSVSAGKIEFSRSKPMTKKKKWRNGNAPARADKNTRRTTIHKHITFFRLVKNNSCSVRLTLPGRVDWSAFARPRTSAFDRVQILHRETPPLGRTSSRRRGFEFRQNEARPGRVDRSPERITDTTALQSEFRTVETQIENSDKYCYGPTMARARVVVVYSLGRWRSPCRPSGRK